MKKAIALTITAVSIGLISVACARNYDRELGWDTQFKDLENSAEFDKMVNARIDRDLSQFNAKDELRLPKFANENSGREFFNQLVFNTTKFSTLSLTYLSSKTNENITYLFDKKSQVMTRTVRGKNPEEYLFSGNMKEVPPIEAYIPYAFAVDFTRIANKITLDDHVAYKTGTNSTETYREPNEYIINDSRCIRYDVELKKRCAPAESLTIFVDEIEKTPVRVKVNFIQPVPEEVPAVAENATPVAETSTVEETVAEAPVAEVEPIPPFTVNITWQEYKLKEDSEETVTMPRIIEYGNQRLVMLDNPVIL